ncbi:MAG: flagellar assembly protein FliH [Pseudomonadota bacterium]|jgi:flagellar assembly protein FliH
MANPQMARKFDFSNSFESNERGMVAARDFTLADIESARAEAFKEGVAAGAEEQRAATEHLAAESLQAIGQRLGDLRGHLDGLRNEIESQALEAVLVISRKLLPHFVEKHGTEEIEGLVRDCLSAVYDEPRVVIRAQDSVLDHVKARLEDLIASSGFSGKVVLLADHAIGLEDCRIEWADGGTERSTSRLWQDIETTIARALGRDVDSGS